jgi:hypothetical protein
VPNEVVLYRTHLFNPMIRREFSRLRAEVADCPHWIVGYLRDDAPAAPIQATNLRMYRRADLAALPYPEKIASATWSKPNGDNDLPVHSFYREQPDYDYYWIVEYDVRFTGHWGKLFDRLRRSKADLLSTTIQDYEENPGWWWWSTLVDAPRGPVQRVRCFNPFCRLSNGALAAIDEWYREGGGGHYEATWSSVCKTVGLRIEDIGGTGRYTPEYWRGRHYVNTPLKPSLSPGSFVYRPPLSDDRIRAQGLKHGPLLWHPVKS